MNCNLYKSLMRGVEGIILTFLIIICCIDIDRVSHSSFVSYSMGTVTVKGRLVYLEWKYRGSCKCQGVFVTTLLCVSIGWGGYFYESGILYYI